MTDKKKKFRSSLGGAIAGPALGLMSFFGSHAQGATTQAPDATRTGLGAPPPASVVQVVGADGRVQYYTLPAGAQIQGGQVVYGAPPQPVFGAPGQGQTVVYGAPQQPVVVVQRGQGEYTRPAPAAGQQGQGNGVTVIKDGNGELQAGKTTSVTAAKQLEEGKPLDEVYDTARGVAAIGDVQLHAKKAENAGRVDDARTDASVASQKAKEAKSKNERLKEEGKTPFQKAQGTVEGISGVLGEADRALKKGKSTFDNAKKTVHSFEGLFNHGKKAGRGGR